jgi:Uma2 family endonuclease
VPRGKVMTTTERPAQQVSPLADEIGCVVLRNISWETYESLLRDLEEQHYYRLTYDGGTLEIMPPSRLHERAGRLLGRIIYAYSEARNIPIASFGSATWRRRDIGKGLEADECYYVASEPRVRGRDEVDIHVDPPPDLAIEVDITRSALDKQRIYAALGVPELWRWEDESLLVLVLGADGQYAAAKKSPSFPELPLDDISRFMSMRHDTSETEWIRLFREWLTSTS